MEIKMTGEENAVAISRTGAQIKILNQDDESHRRITKYVP